MNKKTPRQSIGCGSEIIIKNFENEDSRTDSNKTFQNVSSFRIKSNLDMITPTALIKNESTGFTIDLPDRYTYQMTRVFSENSLVSMVPV